MRLETVREYALEQLAATGDLEDRSRMHALSTSPTSSRAPRNPATVYRREGDLERAESVLEEALALARLRARAPANQVPAISGSRTP